jgi:hypothetical protein
MHWFRKCQIIMPLKTYNNSTNSILAILEFKTWDNHFGNSINDEFKKAFVIESFGFNVWN